MQQIEVKQTEGYEVPFEVLAKSIEQIGTAMEAIGKTRLTRDAIITLIAWRTKIGRDKITYVLNALDQLEDIYLKPKPAKAKKQ